MFNQELRVIGLRRSGQHGVINWMLAQNPLKDKTVFLNNQKLGNEPQGLTASGTLLQSYEDVDLDWLPPQNGSTPNADTLRHILVLRDAPNFFASRVAWQEDGQLTEENRERLVALWKQHAREFIGETTILPSKVPVYFPHWFASRQYRVHLAKVLGLKFSDAGLNCIGHYGKGSSFDGTRFNGKAQHMAVLDRYREMASHSVLQSILKDKELTRLSEQLADYKPKRKHQRMKLKDILNHEVFGASANIPAKIQENIQGRIAGIRRPPLIYTIKVMMGGRCRTYLEIGVLHAGCICCVMQNKYPTTFVGIDPFNGFYGNRFDPNSGSEVTKDIAIRNIQRNNIHKHPFDLIEGCSTDRKIIRKVRRKYPVIDLMYIDGDHSEQAVTSDFKNYGRLVPSGGIIVFDNYGDKAWPGAKLAMDKADLRHWHTVGVWKNSLILERK